MKLVAFNLLIILLFSAYKANCQSPVSINTAFNNEIVFTSDTQGPIWIEKLWLKACNNRKATKKIFASILKQQPKNVFILGDVVSMGSSNKQWKRFDVYLQQLRNKGIKVDAALGNHDLMFQVKKGQEKFQRRFPNHVNTGYVQVTDSVAVVLLNSNFKVLTANEDSIQVNWYAKTLEKLDSDSAIQVIITGCHHSPFSNSRLTGSSSEVREKFVSKFFKSKKSRLFLSGHTHAYEHYNVKGKDFMVIGGGGGLSEKLKPCNNLLPDLAEGYKPMFHYITVKRDADKLQVKSIQLKQDFSGFEDGEFYTISNPILPVKVSTTDELIGSSRK